MIPDLVTKMSLPEIIGKGYKTFWNSKHRYRVLKGGRGSKKSTTASFWFPYNMMKYWHQYGLKPHTLVIRRYYNTHKDSTYAQLKWAINHLGVAHLWKATKSPLELTYIPSGQKIMFRGLDDPQSITSITVEDGYLCWTWWEEAFQCTNEDDFNKVDLSIRGEIPHPLFKQHTLTFNPWSDKIWLKKRFFDIVGSDGVNDEENVLAITRNYDCNEFLGEDDLKIFEQMKKKNPRRYDIEGKGNWGIAEGLIFENWQELEFDIEAMKRSLDTYDRPKYKQLFGMDFGYTNDPTAFIALMVDEKNKEIFIFDEIYKTYMKNEHIRDAIKYKGYDNQRIAADSSAPKDIDTLKDMGLHRIYGAKKPKGSVNSGIQKLQDYKIYVHPRCTNTIVEFSNYVWQPDRDTGKPSNEPMDEYNHLMDALRYATFELGRSNFSW
ncbi:MAG: PBSX family phage terminase, large subunit [Clostridiales bacterium 38_11]|nr:MAG: PBSX family phage terminase, large subunit [Clostridiales bacterium 38_11]